MQFRSPYDVLGNPLQKGDLVLFPTRKGFYLALVKEITPWRVTHQNNTKLVYFSIGYIWNKKFRKYNNILRRRLIRKDSRSLLRVEDRIIRDQDTFTLNYNSDFWELIEKERRSS